MGRVKLLPRECSACGRKAQRLKRTWCGRCYQRWQAHGNPLQVDRIIGDDEARFWPQVDRSGGTDACHPWTGRIDDKGYGDFNVGGRHIKPHGYAYALAKGAVPPGKEIDHTCHDRTVCLLAELCPHRRCCNAEHLEAVTRLENILRSGKTKLSEVDVMALHERWLKGELKQDLAAECGVDPHTISRRFKRLEASMPRVGAYDVQHPGENLPWS